MERERKIERELQIDHSGCPVAATTEALGDECSRATCGGPMGAGVRDPPSAVSLSV